MLWSSLGMTDSRQDVEAMQIIPNLSYKRTNLALSTVESVLQEQIMSRCIQPCVLLHHLFFKGEKTLSLFSAKEHSPLCLFLLSHWVTAWLID